jgi:hypothetical protein
LQKWGLKKGMRVVLAGCETSGASEVIKIVTEMTGKTPVVNKHLAFTSGKGEFIIQEKFSQKLFDERNANLEKVTQKYIEQHEAPLKVLVGDITKKNYRIKHAFVMNLCKLLNMKGCNLSPTKSSEQNYKALKGFWDDTIKSSFLKAKKAKAVKTAIKRLNKLQEDSSKKDLLTVEITNKFPKKCLENYQGCFEKNLAQYFQQHTEILEVCRKEARKVNRTFVNAMEKKLSVTYKDYTVEAFKGGGPIPPMLKTKKILEKVPKQVLEPEVLGSTSVTDVVDIILQYLPIYHVFQRAMKK